MKTAVFVLLLVIFWPLHTASAQPQDPNLRFRGRTVIVIPREAIPISGPSFNTVAEASQYVEEKVIVNQLGEVQLREMRQGRLLELVATRHPQAETQSWSLTLTEGLRNSIAFQLY